MAFDPTIYGLTGGTNAPVFALTPDNLYSSGSVDRPYITGWVATTYGSTVGNWNFTIPSLPRVPPVLSPLGGNHASFGQIFPGGPAYLQSVFTASSGINSANCVLAGVIDCGRGFTAVAGSSGVIFDLSFGDLQLIRTQSGFLQLKGGVSQYTSNIKLPAGPTPFALWCASGDPASGIQIAVFGYPTESSNTIINSGNYEFGGNSKLAYLGVDFGNNVGFYGGIRCLYTWVKKVPGGGNWTTNDLLSVVTGLATTYNVQTSDSLLVVGGDSYGAGYKMSAGEGIAQTLANQYPSKRILCLARAGDTASGVLNNQLNGLLDSRNVAGMSAVNDKALLIFDGHNEILASQFGTHPTSSSYISYKNIYTASGVASGYRIIWSDINPISNVNTDSTVVAYETQRSSYRNAIINSGTINAIKLNYCTQNTGLTPPDSTGPGVRLVTSGSIFYRVYNGNLAAGIANWSLTSVDELHMGPSGWAVVLPYILNSLTIPVSFIGFPKVLNRLNVLQTIKF